MGFVPGTRSFSREPNAAERDCGDACNGDRFTWRFRMRSPPGSAIVLSVLLRTASSTSPLPIDFGFGKSPAAGRISKSTGAHQERSPCSSRAKAVRWPSRPTAVARKRPPRHETSFRALLRVVDLAEPGGAEPSGKRLA